jgi:hypothetical protein
MIDRLIDWWVRWRYDRWQVRIQGRLERRIAAWRGDDDRFDLFE